MRKTTLAIAFAVLLTAVGGRVYHVSYLDNSRYWGIPYHTTRDAAGLLAITEGQENMQESLARLPDSIAKHRRELLALVEQQKYLYNKLFNATVDLEKNSRLDLSLIERIGPAADMYLKDLTKTDEAVFAIASYEAKLPPDSPIRDVMGELRLDLAQETSSKRDYQERIAKWRAEEAERQEKLAEERARMEQLRQEREFQRMMNQPPEPAAQPDGQYQDPNYVAPEPEPIQQPVPGTIEDMNARTSTSIDGEDSNKLGLTHSIMADVAITQTKMVALARTIVHEYELIDAYTAQLNLEKGDATLRVGAELPVSYMFVRDRTAGLLEVGQPLFSCRFSLLFCRQVGEVKGTTGQKSKAPSPTSGRTEDGFLVPIELTDPTGGNGKILHIYEPPTH